MSCHNCTCASAVTEQFPFDARGLAKRFRHAAVFGALGTLMPGEAMRFINDHDPLPLLEQIRQVVGDRIDAQYVQRSPGQVIIDFNVCY